MIRTQIYLSEAAKSHLRRLTKRTGKSQSEIIRQAIDLFAARYEPLDRRGRLRKACGMWRDRSDVPDVRALRDGFDRTFETGEN